jgi:hypothetical protein
VSAVSFTALHPGSKTPLDLGTAKKQGGAGGSSSWEIAVPLVRGAAMVTATLK